jgi:hypothetical protein
MKNFEDFKTSAQIDIINNANKYYMANQDNIDLLAKSHPLSMMPEETNLLQPNLWKAVHWNWFFEQRNIIKPSLFQQLSEFFKRK